MSTLPFLVFLLLGLSMSDGDKKVTRLQPKKPKWDPKIIEENKRIIRAAAQKHGVPEPVALATAFIESNFQADEEGDPKWHENAERFERVVPLDHPYKWERAAWHSYGLFQLLAPYFVGVEEHPSVLLDPRINSDRGARYLAKLLKKHGEDIDAVRLAYVGLPVDRRGELAERVLKKWHRALSKFGYDEPRP